MSDDSGLSALAVVMIVSCAALVMTTNRMYGQPTFFSPHSSSSLDEKDCSGGTSSTGKASRERAATGHGNVFGRVPEFGVLEVILSFLSPADLVGTAAVSTAFRRSSIAEHLWMQHCERTYSWEPTAAQPPLPQLGEARCLEQQQEEHQHRHVQHRHKQQRGEEEEEEEDEERWGGSGRFHRSKACSACSSCCSRSSGGGGYHEATHARPPPAPSTTASRTTADARRSGSCGRNGGNGPPLPSSVSWSCCDRSGYHCPWREAFFRAHRTRPLDLLRELSSSVPSNAQQPPSQPPSEQQCIVVLHGKVYDLTGFLSSHPGGALILQEHASTDATDAFER